MEDDKNIKKISAVEEDFEDGAEDEELDIIDDLEHVEKEEEEDNMWHRLLTSNPENDWDSDYFFNERYFEQ
ncbi:MAG: hypothetical protein ACD_3C00060G0007 [uncultured bacterium (gcode 4)]|uniref:Uncharacterized protein n=1 Tax=uncultured bacterium (gcode 4) TaxID=1234023 RepID=K2G2E5_9BACT|nr:MAG: hypothetical protein ACD_3C00060G0007 [uncultured bacterium (gcode 4)]